MAQADFNIRGLARSLGVILRWRPCFLCPARWRCALDSHVEKMPIGYPNRSLLRRRLDTCSTSQSIHTKATPRPTTTPKNSNVKPGAVSTVNIHNAMQAAYQRLASKNGLGAKYTKAAGIFPAVTVLNLN